MPADGTTGAHVSATTPTIVGSFAATPGKFMTSPRPMICGQVMASATSAASIVAPACSRPGAEGTQDGICT